MKSKINISSVEDVEVKKNLMDAYLIDFGMYNGKILELMYSVFDKNEVLKLYYNNLTSLISINELRGSISTFILKVLGCHSFMSGYKWDILNIILKIDMNDDFISRIMKLF